MRSISPWLLVAALLPAAPSFAETMPVDSVFQSFLPNGEFAFEVAGAIDADAKLFFSEKATCFLVIAAGLPTPIVVNPRERGVDGVPERGLLRRDDGTVDLYADAVFERLTTFQIDGEAVRFEVGGRSLAIVKRPFLVGARTGDVVFAYKPEYARAAQAYKPSAEALQTLSGVGDVTVRTFFGTWCPHCTRLMPRLLRVERELAGRGVRFEYYGLPLPFDGEPEAEKNDIREVPTSIVLRGGKEIGRLTDSKWDTPELSIVTMLGGG